MAARTHLFEAVYTSLQRFAKRLSKRPVISALTRATLRGQKNKQKDMAASIAYFTFLSLFPMILGLFAIAGQLLKAEEAQERLTEFFINLFPVSSDYVESNIESLVHLRGAMGVLSVVLLMWSAKKMVSAIRRSINEALGFSRPFALYLSPLRDFGLTLGIAVIVFLTLTVTPIIEVLSKFELSFFSDQWNAFFNVVSSLLGRFIGSAILIAAIYLMVPFRRLTLGDIIPGVLFATLAIEFGKELFSIYITQVSPLQPVYGSVSTVIATLIWLYFSARILLFGSELIAVLRMTPDSKSSLPEERQNEDSD